MVENLDANIGRLIQYLKRGGEHENTFIVFQSDNGAEGGTREGFAASDPSRSGPVVNTLENLGRARFQTVYQAAPTALRSSPQAVHAQPGLGRP
ncbi:sulfatase-like hydrolase/transferase [Sorangium sp. So ce233]|uniref:sulfatase-like hydrolase/transferase n=1 Tax=Sorangium sp. So ce233 TaxID=3133290 RepID=UPI003F630A82